MEVSNSQTLFPRLKSAKGMVDKTLLLAGDYLGSVWSLVETPTQIARIAYTFSLLGHIDKESSFFKLHSVRREGRRNVHTLLHKQIIIIKLSICLAFGLYQILKLYKTSFSDNNISLIPDLKTLQDIFFRQQHLLGK